MPTVHEGGEIVRAELSGAEILILAGRSHLYEGYTPAESVMGVRVLYELGVRTIVITSYSIHYTKLYERSQMPWMCPRASAW